MIRKTILRGLCLRGLWLYCIAFSSLAIGAIHEVKDGESIQAAVAKAKAGDTIKVFPGTYHETIYVDKDDISLIGIVENGGMASPRWRKNTERRHFVFREWFQRRVVQDHEVQGQCHHGAVGQQLLDSQQLGH